MTKVNIDDYFYTTDESLMNSRVLYDLKFYKKTTDFLEDVMDNEYLLSISADIDDITVAYERYLNNLYQFKRTIQKKINNIKTERNNIK